MPSTTPSGARKPADRKTKAATAAKSELADGPIEFDWHEQRYIIESDVMDDAELLEDVEKERFMSVGERILGDKQWAAWKDANRDDNGRVRATVAADFLKALFEELGQGN